MSRYVTETLLADEKIVATAQLHWAMYIWPGLVCILGLPAAVGSGNVSLLSLGVLWAAYTALKANTTELVLTTHRVVVKTGIIRRDVADILLSRIEGVNYSQSILARLLGYGSIKVRGTGVGAVPIRYIAQPEKFKKQVMMRLAEKSGQ